MNSKSDLMEMIFNTLNIRLKEMSIDLERNIPLIKKPWTISLTTLTLFDFKLKIFNALYYRLQRNQFIIIDSFIHILMNT